MTPFRMRMITGCDDKSAVSFIGHHGAVYSNRVQRIVLTGITAFALYVFVAIAVGNYENRIREPKIRWNRFLDPAGHCHVNRVWQVRWRPARLTG
jgi:hypothetical protein